MPVEKYPDSPAIKGGRQQGRDHTTLMRREVADEMRLLQELSRKAEQDNASQSFDVTACREQKGGQAVDEGDVQPDALPKRRAPRYNKALKEAEEAAKHKPLTQKKYRQLMQEHVDLLPYMLDIMESNSSR
jgi:hypothetical protein